MSCQRVRSRLDAYLVGDLPAAERGWIETHAAGCPACRAELASARRLSAEVAGLSEEVEPPRDLWPEIAGRLASPVPAERRPRWPRWAYLAAAVAIATLSSLLTLWLAPPASRPSASSSAPSAGAAVARLEHARLRREVVAILDDPRSHLSPQTVTEVRRNLAVIDRAVADIEAALDRDPTNPGLELLLAEIYRRETDLLRQVSYAAARS